MVSRIGVFQLPAIKWIALILSGWLRHLDRNDTPPNGRSMRRHAGAPPLACQHSPSRGGPCHNTNCGGMLNCNLNPFSSKEHIFTRLKRRPYELLLRKKVGENFPH